MNLSESSLISERRLRASFLISARRLANAASCARRASTFLWTSSPCSRRSATSAANSSNVFLAFLNRAPISRCILIMWNVQIP